MRSVLFSDGGLRDLDIIFRDDLILNFVSLAPGREANSWGRKASSIPGN